MRPEITALLALADEKLRAAGLLVAGGAWGDASSRARGLMDFDAGLTRQVIGKAVLV